ncbi:MAG: sensor domain-containing diguanylate cyclase [Lysobacteraceae bacterium]
MLLAWLLLLLASPPTPAQAAAPVVEVDATHERIDLVPHMHWLFDPDAVEAPEVMFEVLADGGFEPLPDGRSTFGFRRGAFWFHLRLHNLDAAESRRVLVQHYPLSDRLDLFARYPSGQIVHQRSGDTLPFASRAIAFRQPNFWVDLPEGQTVDVLLRVQSESSMQVPLVLYTHKAFTEMVRQAQLGIGLYYGVLLALFLYNLCLWVTLRDPSYFWYMFHVAGFGLVLFCLNGLAFEHFWPNNAWIQQHSVPISICISQIGMQQFARVFLGLDRRWRVGDLVCQGLIAFFVLWGIASVLLPYRIATPIASAAVIPSVVWIAVVSATTLRRGYRPAGLFLLAWGVFLAGTATFALVAFGVLPKVFLTEYGVQIGSAMEMILLSFALAFRYAALRTENERIVHETKAQLERAVNTRTGELSTALEELAEVNGRLRESNRRDALTGAFNRRWFMSEFERMLSDAREDRRPLGLMMIDLDWFKRINDTHGHIAGDECLRQVARRMQAVLDRHDALLARFGGEEFIAALRDHDQGDTTRVADALRESVAATPVACGGQDVTVTLSIGSFGVAPGEDIGPDEAIRRADAALYAAKAAGRNCVREPRDAPA